jgi:hypothetical protein
MQRAERGAARRDLCLVVRLEVVVGLSNTGYLRDRDVLLRAQYPGSR